LDCRCRSKYSYIERIPALLIPVQAWELMAAVRKVVQGHMPGVDSDFTHQFLQH
jgi:hypothetical protein